MAIEMADTKMMAKIACEDMVALGSKYHTKCLMSYRRKFNKLAKNAENNTEKDDMKASQARAFAELIIYMESMAESGTYMFTLSELHSLYCVRLEEMDSNIHVHKTRLKIQIMEYYGEDIQEQTDGKNTVLVFHEGIKRLLKDALANRNYTDEAITLTKVLKDIRSEVFHETFQFNGSFQEGQSQKIPSSLLWLISVLINGPSLKNSDAEETQACLSIAELIIFNMKKQMRNPEKSQRHNREREPPLPVYLGLNIHAQTRSKSLINQMSNLGLSISYSRVDEITNSLATSVCDQFKSTGVVCPPSLQHGLFTVSAIDNIDHTPLRRLRKDHSTEQELVCSNFKQIFQTFKSNEG